MKHAIMSVSLVIILLSGCDKDDRAKRAASLLNVKTHVAATEMKAAKTVDEKLKVVEIYFEDAGLLTQALDDYMQNNKPSSTELPSTATHDSSELLVPNP